MFFASICVRSSCSANRASPRGTLLDAHASKRGLSPLAAAHRGCVTWGGFVGGGFVGALVAFAEIKHAKRKAFSTYPTMRHSSSGQSGGAGFPVGVVAAFDILVTSVLVPNLLTLLLAAPGLYQPLWLIFGSANPGMVGPALGHGLLLTVCWLASAICAHTFDKDVTGGDESKNFNIWWRLFIAFFVNAWLLFFASSFIGLFQPFRQADVLDMGIDKDVFGPSGLNIDMKVQRQILDLNLDLAMEVLLLGPWRLYCAGVGFKDLEDIWSDYFRQNR